MRLRIKRVAAVSAFGVTLFAIWVLVAAASRAELRAPLPTLLLVDRHGEYLAELPDAPDDPLGYWPADPIPDRVAAAMIAIEDQSFFSHIGVDFSAIVRALVQNARSEKRVSGASTIAMQVARMQDPGARTWMKKIVEAATAILLTQRHGREAVLAHYLRIAPYGNNIHGIQYAARRYLDKPAADLSWAEIAFLASIPQSPSRMNIYRWDGRARAIARGQRILQLLFERGVMGPAELELARAQIESISVPPAPLRPAIALHFVMRLGAQLRAHRPHDPRVVTTLDLRVQEEAQSAAAFLVARWSSRGAENAAMMVVDRETHEVAAYVGSADYFDGDHKGAIDFANVARASGSTLKPFLYGFALDRGVLTPSTIVDDLHRASGATMNADREFLGPLLPRVALGNSRNVPAVNLMHAVGAYDTHELFAVLGLHDRSVGYEHYGSGIAIGLLPVTLADLMGAYTALAGDGRLHDLRWAQDQNIAPARRVLSEETARQITLFLSDPLARLPTFPRMGATEYPFPVALKTGTSENYRDAWTVAYSRRWLVGAWVGRADAQPMTMLGGAGSAARLVRAMMKHLHRDQLRGFDDLSFPPPQDHVPHRVCDRTGLLATAACDHTFIEWFPRGDEPQESCPAHVALAVDTRTGQVASRDVPKEHVEVRTFTALDPRYASWAATHGLVAPPMRATGAPNEVASSNASSPPEITQPENGVELVRDPEVPATSSTLALEAVVDSRVTQLVWYVDGKPFRVVSSPYTARWPLQPGEHVFEARVPYSDQVSRPVRVFVE